MPAPTRRSLFSLLLAALAWLVGRRADASPGTAAVAPATPTAPATPVVLSAVPGYATYSYDSPAVVTSTYDVDGGLIACSSPHVVTYTYEGRRIA